MSVDEADGQLRREYDAAHRRTGRVFEILRAMSLAPDVLSSSIRFYQRVMHREEGLSRRRRELLAVVVSAANDCHY